jgi:hypothetical protein
MIPPSHQTVTLRRGRHDSPAIGACVVELASMLAGERFSDHPRSVCPVIAAFLRGYNDLLPEGEHDELYPYAALVVGTDASGRIQRQRAGRILEWAGLRAGRGRRRLRLCTWDVLLVPAARTAARMEPRQRRARVARLLGELVAIGRPADEPAGDAAPPPAGRADDAGVDRPGFMPRP